MDTHISMTQSLGAPGLSRREQDTAERQEREWIQASQSGNTAAFNHLVLKWERPIYNLALRMMQQTPEAEEVTQEVFFSAYRSIKRFRLDARFSTWLYRIASNKCLTRLRQRPRKQHWSLDDLETPIFDREQLSQSAGQEDQLLRRERRGEILRALQALADEQRLVVELKFYQELKFEEIAAVLDIPTSTAKSRFYTSLRTLKKRLSRMGTLT